MSVIQKIRDKASWFIFGIIALALIAFILQDRFMGKGNGSGNSTTIGKVNGQTIDRNDFAQQVDLFQQMNGGQNVSNGQAVTNVWNRDLYIALLDQEEKKLGLVFTAKELNETLFGANPPQWMTQAFTDPNTGQYNPDAAKQQFAQMKKNINDPKVQQVYTAYIQPTIDQELSQKYTTLVSGAVYVPHWMAQKMKADDESVASIKFVSLPYSTITDTTIKISDDEINAYVDAHKKQFEQKEETRNISYVKFDASPSNADSSAVKNQLDQLKSSFETASDEAAFVSTKGSSKPYDSSYALQSTFKGVGDTLLHLAPGQVFGPYLEGSNYVLAKMIGERSMPDSAKCRHILIKTEDKGQPVLADSIAKKRIDSIADAIAHGADFNAMVQQYSDDQGSKGTKGEYTFPAAQFNSISREFAETIFYGKTADKKVVHVSNAQYAGYHYIEVLDQKNFQPAYNVAYISKPIEASSETISNASTAADQFAASSRTAQLFQDNAKKQNLPLLTANDIKANDFNAGTIGENRQLVKWMYDHNVGEVSDPQSAQNNSAYIVAIITAVHKKGTMDAAAARPSVEAILINQKKAQRLIAKIKGSTLDAVAQSTGTTVIEADSVSFRQPFIPNVGNEPKITGAAFNKNIQGKISASIAGNSGVFVVQGVSIRAQEQPGSTLEDFRTQMEKQKRSALGYGAIGALKDGAKIEDNRSTFY